MEILWALLSIRPQMLPRSFPKPEMPNLCARIKPESISCIGITQENSLFSLCFHVEYDQDDTLMYRGDV
jgi:hypothetical protein